MRFTLRRGAPLILAALLAACSGGGSGKGSSRPRPPEGPRLVRDLDPTELFPADLDLVVRVDVGRMRGGIGPGAPGALASQLGDAGGEAMVRDALACADVVWLATRLGDVEEGDRVLVVEGRDCAPKLDLAVWRRVPSGNGSVGIFDRDLPLPRAATARVITLGERSVAFVSAAERDSVARVLDAGPDERRVSPKAEGIVSAEVRAGRMPPSLEKRFPSLASVIAGLDRVRASVTLVDEGVRIEGEIRGKTPAEADRAARFLTALRDNLAESKYGELARAVTIEPLGGVVRVKLVLPPKVVLGLLEVGAGG